MSAFAPLLVEKRTSSAPHPASPVYEYAVEDGDGRRTELLQVIATKLAAKAADGDLGAIREIFDRMDGKAVAGSAPEQTAEKVQMQWKE